MGTKGYTSCNANTTVLFLCFPCDIHFYVRPIYISLQKVLLTQLFQPNFSDCITATIAWKQSLEHISCTLFYSYWCIMHLCKHPVINCLARRGPVPFFQSDSSLCGWCCRSWWIRLFWSSMFVWMYLYTIGLHVWLSRRISTSRPRVCLSVCKKNTHPVDIILFTCFL